MPRRQKNFNQSKSNTRPNISSAATVGSTKKPSHSHHQFKNSHHDKREAAERKERWARQKLNSSFYLHSSASHAFILNRSSSKSKSNPKLPSQKGNEKGNSNSSSNEDNKARYLTLGTAESEADAVVDWKAVRIVKVLVPAASASTLSPTSTDDNSAITTCAICLDSFVAPRITTCGHIYCYPCILRLFHVNVHVGAESGANANTHHRNRDPIAKCPCCFNHIQLSELKPVLIVTVQPAFCAAASNDNGNGNGNSNSNSGGSNNVTMTFRKCHRKRNSIVPYLPFQVTNGNSNNSKNSGDKSTVVSIRKREEPNDLPSVIQPDSPYCRYNYMDANAYIRHLQNDEKSLHREAQNVKEMYQNLKASSSSKNHGTTSDYNDRYFIEMASNAVEVEVASTVSNLEEQKRLQSEQEARYCNKLKIKIIPYNGQDLNSFDGDQKEEQDKEEVALPSPLSSSSQKDSLAKGMNEHSRKQKFSNQKYSKRGNVHQQSKGDSKKSMHITPGTMYLDDDSVQFYQAIDGQLCFLSGFSLKYLAHEFADKNPNTTHDNENKRQDDDDDDDDIIALPPFPDVIKGNVIDVQTIHITPEVRKRMPFTSHLPLYIDIALVEINVTHLLSVKTLEHFKNEMEVRRKKRQKQRNIEKRAKKEAQQKEDERIKKLKQRIQSIDVNDEFFHVARPTDHIMEENNTMLLGEDFGPSLNSNMTQGTRNRVLPSSSSSRVSKTMSWGAVCASNGHFPELSSSDSSAFPPLSSSSGAAFPPLSSSGGKTRKNMK